MYTPICMYVCMFVFSDKQATIGDRQNVVIKQLIQVGILFGMCVELAQL